MRDADGNGVPGVALASNIIADEWTVWHDIGFIAVPGIPHVVRHTTGDGGVLGRTAQDGLMHITDVTIKTGGGDPDLILFVNGGVTIDCPNGGQESFDVGPLALDKIEPAELRPSSGTCGSIRLSHETDTHQAIALDCRSNLTSAEISARKAEAEARCG